MISHDSKHCQSGFEKGQAVDSPHRFNGADLVSPGAIAMAVYSEQEHFHLVGRPGGRDALPRSAAATIERVSLLFDLSSAEGFL
jgi:hypothetical protein